VAWFEWQRHHFVEVVSKKKRISVSAERLDCSVYRTETNRVRGINEPLKLLQAEQRRHRRHLPRDTH